MQKYRNFFTLCVYDDNDKDNDEFLWYCLQRKCCWIIAGVFKRLGPGHTVSWDPNCIYEKEIFFNIVLFVLPFCWT